MGEFVTYPELATAEDKLNGKIDRGLSEQNTYRHDMAKIINERLNSLDASMEELVKVSIKNESNIENMTNSLKSHLDSEDDDRKEIVLMLKDIKDELKLKEDKKTVWAYLGVFATIAFIITAFLYNRIENQDTKLNSLSDSVGNIEAMLKYGYEIKSLNK